MIHHFDTVLKILSATFGICLLWSCQPSTMSSKRAATYFGGEIVNPNTDYIVLFSTHQPNDTIYLDKNNRFLHQIKHPTEGLYSFKHTPEKQIVLLEQGDSILLRLNTLEFDESLVFTGDGAEKNNFLIDMFLYNEKRRNTLRTMNLKLSPSRFQQQQDSFLKRMNQRHQKLVDNYALSPLAEHITKASFEYALYARKEIYNRKQDTVNAAAFEKDMPDHFFDYRKRIDYNDSTLQKLYAYNRYLRQYVINESRKNNQKNEDNPNTETEHIKYELCIIDDIIQNTYIKNKMLRNTVRTFLLHSESNEDSHTVFEHYKDKKPDPEILKELETLLITTSLLKPSKPIPDQELIAADGTLTHLSSITKKPITAFYFWSTQNKNHYIKAHRKAAALRLMYPDVDFIGINRDDNLQNRTWLQLIKRNQYDLSKEYKFENAKCAEEELVIHYKNKVILLDSVGHIIKSNAKLFSPKLHKIITTYQNTKLDDYLEELAN